MNILHRLILQLFRITRQHAQERQESRYVAPGAPSPHWTPQRSWRGRIGMPERRKPGKGFADDPKITTRVWRARP